MNRNNYLKIAIVAFVMAGLMLVIAASQMRPVAVLSMAQTSGDCWELYKNGTRVFADGCDVIPTDEPTPTLAPTSTPTATPEPTGTPPAGHDTETWHPAGVDFHHHGGDWRDAHPAIVEWLENNDPVWRAIGNEWLTSPTENVFPFPNGKHEGMKNIIENDTHCDNYRSDPSTLCIKAYYLQLHALSTGHEWATDIHSWKGVFLVCERGTDGECAGPAGIVAAGGHSNYGEQHTQYKQTVCNPAQYPAPYSGDQPPYVSVNGTDRRAMLWSSSINPLMQQFFNPVPGRFMQIVWAEFPWSVPHADPDLCNDREQDIVYCEVTNGDCNNNGTRFQVFDLFLKFDQYPQRPFSAFLDVHGALNSSCLETGPNCIPLYIGEDVPVAIRGQRASFNRDANIGPGSQAPILNYDTGAELHIPGFDVDGH